MHRHLLLLALPLLLAAPPAMARIKLSALPERERVEIQLDHGRSTLVEEERVVPLLESTNRVDFSWSNAQIDKDSIRFRPLAIRDAGVFRPLREGEIAVVNVAYPPGENALVWEVSARKACALKVRVSYLIRNLTRTFAYRALAEKDERHLVLKKYIQLKNYSGEEFGEAGVWAGFGPKFTKRVGQQTDLKMLLRRFDRVPVTKTYTFDWYAHGPLDPDKPFASRVLMHYKLRNDKKHALGAFPLQPGKVRIFIRDGHGGEAFLGEDWARLTPIDGEMRLFLGDARDVLCTRTIQTNQRHVVRGNLFDLEIRIRYEIENFKDQAVRLDIAEQMNRIAAQYGAQPRGDAEWEVGPDTTPGLEITRERGGALPVLRVDLPPRPAGGGPAEKKVEKKVVTFHFTIKHLWK